MPRSESIVMAFDKGTTLIEIAMIIFMAVFVAIVIRVMLTRSNYYQKASQIPLEEDRVVTPRDGKEQDDAGRQ